MSFSRGKPDWIFLGMVLAIVAIGFVTLASASQALAFRTFGDHWYFIVRHGIYLGVGMALGAVCALLPLSLLKRVWLMGYGVSVVLLALVLIPGVGQSFGRAQSWFQLGSLTFQPSELAKLCIILFFSVWFARKRSVVTSAGDGTIPFVLFTGLMVGLIALQPDPGTLIIVAAVAMAMFFFAGAKWSHVGVLAGMGAVAFGILILIAPYRISRIEAFLHPERDPQGTGYHTLSAIEAVKRGGVFGQGLGKSESKYRFLPEAAGDSIFAVYAEELGFFFSSLLIVLFLGVAYRGINIARATPDFFSQLFAGGVSVWFFMQACVNIGAMVRLLPLTGLPLPFISYGGSALIAELAAVGIVMNISRYARL